MPRSPPTCARPPTQQDGTRRCPRASGAPTRIASAVFTVPPLASAGLTEDAARAAGLKFRTNCQDTEAWYNTRRVGEIASGFKVLIEEGTGRILGAHLLGPSAAEIINLFAIAIRLRIPAFDLKQVPFAYPTYGFDIRFNDLSRAPAARKVQGGQQ